VRGSSGINNTLSIDALPADVTAGDVIHLMNLGGLGFRPQFYNRQIAAAVRLARPDALFKIQQEADDPFDADTGAIDIPDDFVAVYGVRYTDGDFLREVRQAGRRHGEYGQGWYLDKPARQIRIDGSYADDMDASAVTIMGYTFHGVPNSDADLIALDPQWLLYQTASMMANTRLVDARWNNWAVEWGRTAQTMRGNIWTPRAPNTVFPLDGRRI
jgi:hypothetical protein